MTDAPRTRLTLRLDFGPAGQIGPGKARLLEEIGRHGSISAAGRALGMSYRRAWLLVDEINRTFHGPAVTTRPGGPGGGGAALTPWGERLIHLYRSMEVAAMGAAAGSIAELERELAQGPAPVPAGEAPDD